MQPFRSKPRGFTIVELMVSLAVAAILIGFALPAFNDFVDQRRMASRANDFILAINYARSEAARRGGQVSVQAAAPTGANEWGGGYCVVPEEDNAGDCSGNVLRLFDPIPVAEGTFDATNGLNNRTTLTFNARGMLTPGVVDSNNSRIRLCGIDADSDPGRVVNLTLTGRPNVEVEECFP